MKKTMFAVLCLAMTAMTVMAKDNNVQKGHMNKPRHEMVDPVINMEIVGQMGLSDKKVQQIANLKVKKQEEMKALRAQHQPKAGKKANHGMKHHAAPGQQPMAKKTPQKGEHRAKMQAINEKYRKDMQDIMGTKTYVKYVEKVNDHLAMHQPHGKHHKGHGQKMHKGNKMHKHQNGFQHQKPQHGKPEKV